MTESPASPSTRPQRLAGIEGARAVAAVSVMVGHVFIVLNGGLIPPGSVIVLFALLLQGLTLFFVLSGFLLYRPYVAALLDRRSLPSPTAFYRNRLLRIWPAYLVILVVAGLIADAVITRSARFGEDSIDPALVGRLTRPWTLLANVFLVQGYSPSTVMTGLSVSWSLVAELAFYLVLPGLAWLASRAVGRLGAGRAAVLPAVALLVVGLGCRVVASRFGGTDLDLAAFYQSGGSWHTVFGRSLLAQADLFGLGMLAAVIQQLAVRRSAHGGSLARTHRRLTITLVVSLAVVFLLRTSTLVAPFAGALCLAVIALMTVPAPTRIGRVLTAVLEVPVVRYLGKISYSIYLWHLPLLFFAREHASWLGHGSAWGLVESIVVIGVATVALASVTYHVVEQPALRLKSRRAPRHLVVHGPAASLAGSATSEPA